MGLSCLLYLPFFFLIFPPAATSVPETTVEVVVGNSTRIRCGRLTEEWYFKPTGVAANHDQDIFFEADRIPKRYGDRAYVNRTDAGLDLVFTSVSLNDSGRYRCSASSGDALQYTELIVLTSYPKCHWNRTSMDIIGSNGLNVGQEDLELSCSVSFKGNSSPILQWFRYGDNSSVPLKASCSSNATYHTCVLQVTADSIRNGESFLCQTTRSVTEQYGCRTDAVQMHTTWTPNDDLKIIGNPPKSAYDVLPIVLVVVIVVLVLIIVCLGLLLRKSRRKRMNRELLNV